MENHFDRDRLMPSSPGGTGLAGGAGHGVHSREQGRDWKPLSGRLLEAILRRVVRKGTLILTTPDLRTRRIGEGAPRVSMEITSWAAVRRIVLNPDLALGEAYMDGTLRVGNGSVYDLLELLLANLGRQTGPWPRRVQHLVRRLVRRITLHNPVGVARRNVAHHYDLSDRLYSLFLDAERQYSCAYYKSPEDSLEQAQAQKMRHIAAKLLLEPGQRVLDIGSGWGGLAMSIARQADVDVTGVTLSEEQHRYANRTAEEAGLSGKVRFALQDYRNETGRYDRIVSVGMFEHVGVGHYREYFAKLAELLDEDGVALVHTIGDAGGPGAPQPWIRKYIFPGGYIPSLSEIMPAIEHAGLFVTDIEMLRLHYAETLKAWQERFQQNREIVSELYDERFCRMWEFYLASCEAGFRRGGLLVFQIQLSKRNDAVPLTRDYIAGAEAGAA